jgi:hypothetical protein
LYKNNKGKKAVPKKAQVMTIEEKPGKQFPDLESAQLAALPFFAESLQSLIREMLESGELILVNNKIIPAEEKP